MSVVRCPLSLVRCQLTVCSVLRRPRSLARRQQSSVSLSHSLSLPLSLSLSLSLGVAIVNVVDTFQHENIYIYMYIKSICLCVVCVQMHNPSVCISFGLSVEANSLPRNFQSSLERFSIAVSAYCIDKLSAAWLNSLSGSIRHFA